MEWQRFTVRHAAVTNPVGFTVSNVVYADWEVETKLPGREAGRHLGISVIRFRGGKAVDVRDYVFDPAALDAMWMQEPVAAGAL